MDRDKALTWQTRERQKCSACGTRHEEWDPEDGGRENAYVAVMTQCPGCAETQRMQQVVSEEDGLGVKVQLWTPEYRDALRRLEQAKQAVETATEVAAP